MRGNPFVKSRVPPEMLAEIEKLSEETGVPVSEIIRACIRRALPYVAMVAKSNRIIEAPNGIEEAHQ